MSKDHSTVTLNEVARLAGVSPSTVSRYISGTHQVAPEKRLAIEGSIKQLGYRPNLVARGLAKGRTMTVGVLTQEISSTYFSEAMRGVEDALIGHDYQTIFVNGHWSPREEERRLESLIGRQVDGVILLQTGLGDDVLDLHARTVPLVLLGGRSASLHVRSIDFDHCAGARLAVQHLIELGHRRIAFIRGPQGRHDAEERLRGYREALSAAGMGYDEGLVANGAYVESGGLQAMNTLMDRGGDFTAVFAANDDSAYGAILALHRRGLRVPDDVSLVGYDDLPHSSYTVPPLTSVRQPLGELSREVANAAIGMIEGRKPTPALLPPVQLIIRESTKTRPLGR